MLTASIQAPQITASQRRVGKPRELLERVCLRLL